MKEQKIKYYLDNRNFSRERRAKQAAAPNARLQLVNNRIVLNAAPQTTEEEELITSYTYMTNKSSGSKKRWNADDDEVFFKSLRCCGSEFSMINILFPDRSRKNIKEKFKREMKQNRAKVEDALGGFCSFDLELFTELKDRVAEKRVA